MTDGSHKNIIYMNFVTNFNPHQYAKAVNTIAATEREYGADFTNKATKIVDMGQIKKACWWVGAGLVGFCGYKFLSSYFDKKKKKADVAFQKEIDDNKTENKCKIVNAKREATEAISRTRTEEKMKLEEKRKSSQNPSELLTPDKETDYTPTPWEEAIAGDTIDPTDLRIGLRWIHLGGDCGLIGRTNIGKSTFVLHYGINVARGYQTPDARLGSDWCMSQPMTVIYFALEHTKKHFQAKYRKHLPKIPNFHLELKIAPDDLKSMKAKIINLQEQIGDRRLLVIFDNITKIHKTADKDEKRAFFRWLESYRHQCAAEGKPITYLKIYHTQGRYTDDMPILYNTNYGDKTDTMFTQDLVGFGMCKDGDGQYRYIKELKNKDELDGGKETLSVFKFAYTPKQIAAGEGAPMYDYVGEALEKEVLPTAQELVRSNEAYIYKPAPKKRGPKERFTKDELIKMYEELETKKSWKEVFESRGLTFDKNKRNGVKKAFKKHGIGKYCETV